MLSTCRNLLDAIHDIYRNSGLSLDINRVAISTDSQNVFDWTLCRTRTAYIIQIQCKLPVCCRRAKSYEGLKRLDLAIKDLEAASQLEPSNKAIQNFLQNVRTKLKDEDAPLAKAMGKLFT